MKFILFILFVLCVLCGEWEYDFIECEQLFMIYLWWWQLATERRVWTAVSRGLSRVSVTTDQSERQSGEQRPMCRNIVTLPCYVCHGWGIGFMTPNFSSLTGLVRPKTDRDHSFLASVVLLLVAQHSSDDKRETRQRLVWWDTELRTRHAGDWDKFGGNVYMLNFATYNWLWARAALWQ